MVERAPTRKEMQIQQGIARVLTLTEEMPEWKGQKKKAKKRRRRRKKKAAETVLALSQHHTGCRCVACTGMTVRGMHSQLTRDCWRAAGAALVAMSNPGGAMSGASCSSHRFVFVVAIVRRRRCFTVVVVVVLVVAFSVVFVPSVGFFFPFCLCLRRRRRRCRRRRRRVHGGEGR